MKIKVELTRDGKKTQALVRQLPERGRALRANVAYRVAHMVVERVRHYMPGGDELRSYRDSLKERAVAGTPSSDVFLVRSEASRTESVDPASTLFFIRPRKRRRARMARAVEVLARFGPWTASTLPFLPTRRQASVVFRRVTAREVRGVAKQREEDAPRWRRALARAGVRATAKAPMTWAKAPSGVIPDVAFEALALEFGPLHPRPHWRPALRDAVRSVSSLHRNRELVKLLTDPADTGWKRATPRLRRVRSLELRKYVAFQRRLRP